jgi:beta-phosphoglucomutase-like phosphatase (HAD superfamily)
MLPNAVHAVIFDMDGLLIDTERIYFAAIMGAVRAHGFEISEASCHAMIGIPGKDCDRMIAERFGSSFPMAAYRNTFSARVAALMDAGIAVKPGAVELIDYLAERGMPVAVATSASRKSAVHHLGKAGLLDRFRRLVTRDDVPRGKPSPDVFHKAARELDCDPGDVRGGAAEPARGPRPAGRSATGLIRLPRDGRHRAR